MHEVNFYKPMLLFHIVVTLCSIVFAFGIYINLKIILAGRRGRKFQNNPEQILSFLIKDIIFQIPILKLSFFRWIIHHLIFWGFVGLFIGTTRLFIYTDILRNDLVLLGQDIACDIAGIMLLAGIVLAFLRRAFSRSPSVLTEFEDWTLLVILLILDLSGFLTESARIALSQGGATERSFAGIWLAKYLSWISPTTATVIWTIHALASALFIAYIPFSKFWHVFTAPSALALNPEKNFKENLYEKDRPFNIHAKTAP